METLVTMESNTLHCDMDSTSNVYAHFTIEGEEKAPGHALNQISMFPGW